MPAQPTRNAEARLLEVFSSIQGEGGLVGCRQVFLRFAGCNLDCDYCDTDFSSAESCRIEDAPGSGEFRSVANPVALEVLAGILEGWRASAPGMHHSISLTGGEPLLQAAVLQEWAPVLREILPLHLETNGTLTEGLAMLMPHLDWVSMDVKLASVTGVPTPWQEHRDFLELAAQTNTWVKAVVGDNTSEEEMVTLGRMVHRVAPGVFVYLQPVTLRGEVGASAAQLLRLQTALSGAHPHVRIVPQTHVFMQLL